MEMVPIDGSESKRNHRTHKFESVDSSGAQDETQLPSLEAMLKLEEDTKRLNSVNTDGVIYSVGCFVSRPIATITLENVENFLLTFCSGFHSHLVFHSYRCCPPLPNHPLFNICLLWQPSSQPRRECYIPLRKLGDWQRSRRVQLNALGNRVALVSGSWVRQDGHSCVHVLFSY